MATVFTLHQDEPETTTAEQVAWMQGYVDQTAEMLPHLPRDEAHRIAKSRASLAWARSFGVLPGQVA